MGRIHPRETVSGAGCTPGLSAMVEAAHRVPYFSVPASVDYKKELGVQGFGAVRVILGAVTVRIKAIPEAKSANILDSGGELVLANCRGRENTAAE